MRESIITRIENALRETLANEIRAHCGDIDQNFPEVKKRKGYIAGIETALDIIEDEKEKDE